MPEEQILWTERRWGGLVRVMHYIEIEALTGTRLRSSRAGRSSGLLGDLFVARRRKALSRGFRAFCEAVKAARRSALARAGRQPTSKPE